MDFESSGLRGGRGLAPRAGELVQLCLQHGVLENHAIVVELLQRVQGTVERIARVVGSAQEIVSTLIVIFIRRQGSLDRVLYLYVLISASLPTCMTLISLLDSCSLIGPLLPGE